MRKNLIPVDFAGFSTKTTQERELERSCAVGTADELSFQNCFICSHECLSSLHVHLSEEWYEICRTRMAAQCLNHAGINAVAVTWQWIFLLSSLIKFFHFSPCLPPSEQLKSNTSVLTLRKSVCTLTLLSLRSLSKTYAFIYCKYPSATQNILCTQPWFENCECRCWPTKGLTPM